MVDKILGRFSQSSSMNLGSLFGHFHVDKTGISGDSAAQNKLAIFLNRAICRMSKHAVQMIQTDQNAEIYSLTTSVNIIK